MRKKKKRPIRELRKKGIYLIPNLFTSGNLFCGVFAIISVFNGHFSTAATAILIATVFDMLDGKLARLTNTTSRFGLEYDSLSDLVSFGVAPALLAYSWGLQSYGRLGWVAVFLFIVCGALRLARFNVQVSGPESKGFIGLPIPAAATLVATTITLDGYILDFGKEVRPVLMLGVIYVLAFLMVSNIRYRSFKDLNLRDRKPFGALVGLVLILLVLVTAPQVMLFSAIFLYVLSGITERPLIALYRKFGKQPPEDSLLQAEEEIEDIEDKEIILKH
ncbi:MAG: CDP-diacylglycerol--serine O-phosphatidyltransferase [Nitrospira sp.]|nr:CDP-diacylglycerol--serine O-phosphatidyltransferase [Candidatus Manganitrophaceae bacterium]HIL34884.1 CDP-diacylglycerol--serine O-phosphatidyltransferase [Candidatus Manganitrophaceae bacterium]